MNPAELNALPPPRFWRRVFCNLYEQLLLVGVLALTFMVPNLLIGVLLGIAIPGWLSFFYLYGVLGFYFVWYWRRNGQTLAMQTWRMQIVAENGRPLAKNQALWRYVYGSLWIVPCLIVHAIYPLRGWQIIGLLFTVSLFLWPLSMFLDRKHRQGVPDRMAQTKLIQLPPKAKVSATSTPKAD
ncbi:RDD family protein [Polynucleobacter acidiphobus]|uniref:RDD family protein n=1 Tax=Polynucleobacter acidiphobus TaxID=556053 RepID=UPI000D3BC528|nr:RDD family protein [Polynucleobacter acidiphobus]